MKKLYKAVTVCLLVLAPVTLIKTVGHAADPSEDLAQEAQRNRELLEIWKDHVKTLTKERDSAYKELERLKASGAPTQPAPMARFGGVETQAIATPEAASQIQNLQGEVVRLRAELEERSQAPAPTGDSNRELQMQFSSLQSQLQQVKKELNETRNDKDRLIQEKEKALSQVERLTAELENAQSAPASTGPSKDPITVNLQKALDLQRKRFEDLQVKYSALEADMESLRSTKEAESSSSAMQAITAARSKDQDRLRELGAKIEELQTQNETLRQQASQTNAKAGQTEQEAAREARELRYENETLKARIAKLQVVEKELESTRAYFTPMLKDLQDKNQRLNEENENLKADFVRVRAETDGAARQSGEYVTRNKQLAAQLQTIKAEQEEAANQIADLKSQLQLSAADKDKYGGMESELQRISTENDSIRRAYAELENKFKVQDAALRDATAQLTAIQRSGTDNRDREQKLVKQVEMYRAKLKANLTDMKNLKSNFEAYLESLVASFDERQTQQ